MRRRELLSSVAALVTLASLPARAAGNGTIPGAIRWDAWYGSNGTDAQATVNAQVSQALGPTVFQARSPWFGTPTSSFLMSINGNQQATMDAEINYAVGGGLKYWAYVMYDHQNPPSSLMNAWALHQSSSIKNLMNWCMILQLGKLSAASMAANQAAYVSYFQQANYQTVTISATVRPLLYILFDTTVTFDLATAITNLRAATVAAGLGTPYIVAMNGTPSTAAGYVTTYGLDAISSYLGGTSGVQQTWATFEATVETFWATMAATAKPIVPICMVSRDQRPRLLHTATFESNKPNVNMSVYATAPTSSELTAHLQAAVSYVVANPSACESKAIIIYSWDECDEFGGIIPSYNAANPAAPVTTALNAVGAVTW